MTQAHPEPASPALGVGAPFSPFDELLEVCRWRCERQHPPTGFEIVTREDGAQVAAVKPGHLNPATKQAYTHALRVEARRWYDRTPEGARRRLTGAHGGTARLSRNLASARGLTVAHSGDLITTLNTGD